MASLPLLRRLYFLYLSRAYAVMYGLIQRRILGFRLSNLVRWLPILLLLFGWLRDWPAGILIALLVFITWINFSLWRAKRDNFNRFVTDDKNIPGDTDETNVLPPNKKVSILTTGLFSVSGRESNLLLRPADYWHVPLGDHVVMAEELPGKFLYQFFSASSLQVIQRGWLLFGPEPIETLAVTFLARWGPEYTRFGQVYEDGSDIGMPPPKRVTIYLSTADGKIRQAIWHTIVSDARQARLNSVSGSR